ncbi:Nucleobase-ascorbate transporter 6-like protein [Drosera capensis]
MAGGGGPTKAEEPTPHPPKDQLPNVSYCITSPPPWPEAIILGFQHYLVMLGTTVLIPTALVPQMGGGNVEKAEVIQTLLFVAGLNTLLQSTFGTRLPAVMGGSLTYIVPTLSIIQAGRYNNIPDPILKFRRSMRGIQGALIVASTLQIVLGFSGLWRNVTRFLSPLSAVPLVSLVGFGLYALGFPGVVKCVEIGLPQLIILILIAQYLPHLLKFGRNVFERFAVIFSVVIVWIYAVLLTVGGAYNNAAPQTQATCRTDRAGLISAAPWIRVPYPFQYGPPTFDAGEAFAMMFASFVVLVEVSLLAPSLQSRGLRVQRHCLLLFSAVVLAGRDWAFSCLDCLGLRREPQYQCKSAGYMSSVLAMPFRENAGLLTLTRVGSRRVVQISAVFMIFFSILGKFGAVFASIPPPIVAALYCLFFAYMGSVGLSFLQFCNLNSFRTKFILGISIFLGLSIPQYFNEFTAINKHGPVYTGARWFNDMVNVPFASAPFVAAIIAYFLDNTLQPRDSSVRKDRGKHWWDKFRSFKGDTRSEEFYSLPFNLNKYFPSV